MKRVVLASVVMAVVLGGVVCRSDRPAELLGPDSTWTGAPTSFMIRSVSRLGQETGLVVDWGDGSVDTVDRLDIIAEVHHAWEGPGEYTIRLRPVGFGSPAVVSARELPVKVLPGAPVGEASDGVLPRRGQDGNRRYPELSLAHGTVKWWWWSPGVSGEEPPVTAPVVMMCGGEELIYTSPGWPNRIYGISVVSGVEVRSGTPVFPEQENAFTGHPAYCEQTQHIIVGNEDGELYAFTTDLSRVWNWPDSSLQGQTYLEWGAPAIHGSNIYVPRDDDTLYWFIDNGTSVTVAACYFIPGLGEAAVVDSDGNVYVASSWGWLFKFPSDLSTPIWTKLVSATNHELFVPAIGSDGAIFIGGSDSMFYAVDPVSGDVRWSHRLVGQAYRCVVGHSAIYVTTGRGMLYSLTAGGSQNWVVQLSPTSTEIVAGPVLTMNGLIYAQDCDDMLYCVRQSDGHVLWTCDCRDFGPRAGRKSGRRDIALMEASLAIAANGDVIVVGNEALYCVAGYPNGTLAHSAWPKWQQNAYNTGRAAFGPGGW